MSAVLHKASFACIVLSLITLLSSATSMVAIVALTARKRHTAHCALREEYCFVKRRVLRMMSRKDGVKRMSLGNWTAVCVDE